MDFFCKGFDEKYKEIELAFKNISFKNSILARQKTFSLHYSQIAIPWTSKKLFLKFICLRILWDLKTINLIVFNTIYILSCTRDLEQINSFNLDQVCSNTRVPTRVNTSITRVDTNPTQVNMNQHKSKSVLDELTWVNTSPTRV